MARNAARRFLENVVVVVEVRNEREIVKKQGVCGTAEGFPISIPEPFICMRPFFSSMFIGKIFSKDHPLLRRTTYNGTRTRVVHREKRRQEETDDHR